MIGPVAVFLAVAALCAQACPMFGGPGCTCGFTSSYLPPPCLPPPCLPPPCLPPPCLPPPCLPPPCLPPPPCSPTCVSLPCSTTCMPTPFCSQCSQSPCNQVSVPILPPSCLGSFFQVPCYPSAACLCK